MSNERVNELELLLFESYNVIKKDIEDIGPCDHEVGICICGLEDLCARIDKTLFAMDDGGLSLFTAQRIVGYLGSFGVECISSLDKISRYIKVSRDDMVKVYPGNGCPEAAGGSYEACKKDIEKNCLPLGVSIIWYKVDDDYYIIDEIVKTKTKQ